MSIRRIVHGAISAYAKFNNKGEIVNKRFLAFPVSLYFEKAAHLTFYFQSRIAYEPIIQNRLHKYINKGNTVFDIGSNIGQYAMVFSYLAGKEGKVIAFEPDENNFTFLQLNARKNKCSNLVLVNKGVASQSTIATFFKDSSTGGRRGSFIKEYVGETFQGEKSEVQLTTFSDAVNEFGVPDFVKIDVEGFEEEVIKGIQSDISHTTFLIEVRKETGASIFKFFSEKGFTCICIDSNVDMPILSVNDIPDFCNLLFLPK